jgi:hypothetical protein
MGRISGVKDKDVVARLATETVVSGPLTKQVRPFPGGRRLSDAS